MAALVKRSGVWYIDMVVAGQRIRASLGTKIKDAAVRNYGLILHGCQDPKSEVWSKLRVTLPKRTIEKFEDVFLGREKESRIREVERQFLKDLEKDVAAGRLAKSTRHKIYQTMKKFIQWLAEKKIQTVREINSELVEEFVEQRKQGIQFAGGTGAGAQSEAICVKKFLSYCERLGLLPRILLPKVSGLEEPEGTKPFTEEELARMETNLPWEFETPYLLLRWTGMRVGDVAGLKWGEVDLTNRRISRITEKRRKRVVIPVNGKLLAALKRYYDYAPPAPTDEVCVGWSKQKIYRGVLELGKKSLVENAHPHRFRVTMSVYLLSKGASLIDVAKVLGDTTETVAKHYAPFVDGWQNRIEKLLEGEQNA